MQQNGPQNPYETYCYQCNVSAPADAKRCVHCGGRLSRQQGVPPEMSGSPLEALDEDEQPRAGGLISPMTVVWILLFIGGSLYRMCS